MKKEEIQFLNQLVKTLENAEKDLRRSYEKRDSNRFNKSKKMIIKIQKEISEMIKWG